MSEIERVVTEFIGREILQGNDVGELSSSTKLIGEGILDSLGALMLIEFIESRFGIRIEAYEVDAEHMGTIEHLVRMVESKQTATAS